MGGIELRHKKRRRLPRKKVLVICYGPVAIGKQYESPWEDLTIRYKTRPGKAINRWLTCVSYNALLQDIEFEKELITEYPEHDESYTKVLLNLQDIVNKLEQNDIYCNEEDGDLYTKSENINRVECERMMNEFMKIKGFSNIKYVWKRPDFCIQPM